MRYVDLVLNMGLGQRHFIIKVILLQSYFSTFYTRLFAARVNLVGHFYFNERCWFYLLITILCYACTIHSGVTGHWIFHSSSWY